MLSLIYDRKKKGGGGTLAAYIGRLSIITEVLELIIHVYCMFSHLAHYYEHSVKKSEV